MSFNLSSYRTRSILKHIAFWVGYLILLNSVYAGIGISFYLIFLRNFIIAIFHIFVVYFNLWYLIPIFYEKNRYVIYYTSVLMMVGVITPLRILVDEWLWKGATDIPTEFYTLPHFGNIIISTVVMLFVSSSWRAAEQQHKNEQLKQELKNYRLEAQLKFLRTQINPHFLFNALNNIYALSLTGSQQTPNALMRLSGIMRYMVEASNTEQVPLSKEIQYLKNFIEIQQLKKSYTQDIEFDIEGPVQGYFIEPLIFIPLVENSFKHGNIEQTKTGWVKMYLKTSPQYVEFTIMNTIAPTSLKKPILYAESSGIGLDNVQQRLQLHYPNQHEFSLTQSDKVFTVYVKIPLK